MSKHQEQIIAAAKGKIDEEILAAAWGKPRGATTAAAGGSFKLEGKPGDMKELAEVFARTKGAA